MLIKIYKSGSCYCRPGPGVLHVFVGQLLESDYVILLYLVNCHRQSPVLRKQQQRTSAGLLQFSRLPCAVVVNLHVVRYVQGLDAP